MAYTEIERYTCDICSAIEEVSISDSIVGNGIDEILKKGWIFVYPYININKDKKYIERIDSLDICSNCKSKVIPNLVEASTIDSSEEGKDSILFESEEDLKNWILKLRG